MTQSPAVAASRAFPAPLPAGATTVAEDVRRAIADGARLQPRGAGTWWPDPAPGVRALDLSALHEVSRLEPADLVVTAGAGCRLDDLAARLAAAGVWLALDPAGSAGRTVGSVLATGGAGPLAARYGAPRDQVLGLTVVAGNGVAVRMGGRVVKNVAGFDVAKAVVGGHGAFGAIVEAHLRLHALPAADRSLAWAGSRREVGAAAARILAAGAAPAALEVLDPPLAHQVIGSDGWALLVRDLGGAAAADEELAVVGGAVGPDAPRGARRPGGGVAAVARDGRRVARAAAHRRGPGGVGRRRRARAGALRRPARHQRDGATGQRAGRVRRRRPGSAARPARRRRAPRLAGGVGARGRVAPRGRRRLGRTGRRSAPAHRAPAAGVRPERRLRDAALPVSALAYAGLDACVHCGFCLPACPTYEATLDEADSPRGRIVLMRALVRGEVPADDAALTHHLDRCLGCRACETACPSGVSYGPAIEAAHAQVAAARPEAAPVAVGLWALARPERQRLAWWAARLARASGAPAALARGAGAGAPALVRMLAMLAATAPLRRGTGAQGHGGTGAAQPPDTDAPDAPSTPTRGPTSPTPPRHCSAAASWTASSATSTPPPSGRSPSNGVAVVEVPRQVCCGALAAHAGRADLARELARENVRAFDTGAPGRTIVTNSAGCGAMLKAYGAWLADDPLAERARAFAGRVRDISELLVERGPEPAARPLPLRVAYDAPCHLHHAQRVTTEPLRVLAAIPGLELVPLEGADRCCGSAGLYSLVEPDLSAAVLAPKLQAIAAAGADVVVTGNPGCLMQIGAGALLAGMRVEVRHPVELLDLAYRA